MLNRLISIIFFNYFSYINNSLSIMENENRNTSMNFLKKINKKKQMMKIGFKEIICPKFLNKSESAKVLTRIEKYVNKNISIENIINKLHEIEKIKFLLMDDHALLLFKYVPNPNLITEEEVTDNKIQDLWNKNWIETNNDWDKEKEIMTIKNQISNENSSKKFKKLLTLL